MKMFKVRKLILENDEDTLKQYGFVLDDYKITHWSVYNTVYTHGSLDLSKQVATF